MRPPLPSPSVAMAWRQRTADITTGALKGHASIAPFLNFRGELEKILSQEEQRLLFLSRYHSSFLFAAVIFAFLAFFFSFRALFFAAFLSSISAASSGVMRL